MEKITCDKCKTPNSANSRYCKNCGYELPKVVVNRQEPIKMVDRKYKLNKSNVLGIIVGAIACGLAYWGVQKLFFTPPSFDKQLMTIASELNKSCPMMVDAQTQLDNSISLPNNIFQYNYTLLETEQSTIDTNEFKAYMEPNILEQIKTNPQMKIFRENKVTMNYLYRDKNKKYIVLISITPSLYE